ncbi:MAG: hypothetical protein AAF682_27625 [Planctomycetota bacterium]
MTAPKPTGGATVRRRYVIAFAALLVCVPAAGAAAGFALLRTNLLRSGRCRAHVPGLEFGMSLEEVVELVGRPPKRIVRFRGGTVAYFEQRVFRRTQPGEPLPPVEELAELPYIYAALQVLFDRRGKLVADTRMGESNCIHTDRGSHPRKTSLAQLSDAELRELIR